MQISAQALFDTKGTGAPRREAEPAGALHLPDRLVGPQRDAVLPNRYLRSGAIRANPVRSDGRRRMPHVRPSLSPRSRHVRHAQHEGSDRRGAAHWPNRDIRFVCVSTGGRIVGLGDIGANGMGSRLANCNCTPRARRSSMHSAIRDDRMPKAVYHAYGYVKKAASTAGS